MSEAVPTHDPVPYAPSYSSLEGCEARELYEKYKVSVKEEVRTNMAKEWFGIIVGFPLPGSRGSITWKLESEATSAYKEGRYEEALDRFCHWLAIVDTDPSTGVVSEMRATLTSNVGACLSQMGRLPNAIEFYERALQEFKALPFSVIRDVNLSRLVYGKLVNKRVEYVEGKLADLKAGKAPPPDTYQDGFGVTRHWSAEEMAGQVVWKWTDPTTWFRFTSAAVYRRMGEQRTVMLDAPAAVTPNAEMI